MPLDRNKAQLFMSNGYLVATVDVGMVDGKWPLVVRYAGFSYVLQNGRYVRANMADGDSLGVAR